jgi:hypothetical protein
MEEGTASMIICDRCASSRGVVEFRVDLIMRVQQKWHLCGSCKESLDKELSVVYDRFFRWLPAYIKHLNCEQVRDAYKMAQAADERSP